ncbi:MAG: DUF1850 domain-containing protein [Halomonas sp.]|uniref:DUF1850 domain-containing protein n=1 Tax=Halomonas sp. TaxID=1486246 RepID=UPI0019EAB055|nr:DUF1850 domain-containing protein [Halomonas sp.]MBE0487525.1 DUF1850 domain-containing protein [Halomonas sp.]
MIHAVSRRALGPAAFALCLLLALASEASGEGWLEVTADNGRRIASLPMPEGEAWCLEWNHSVTGIRVQDCYRHREGLMVLERSHQPDFAAGLGHVPGRGRQVSDGEGGYWIEEIDEPVPGNRYRLRVGSPEVNHRLLHEGRRLSLSDQAAGERVMIHLRTSASTS